MNKHLQFSCCIIFMMVSLSSCRTQLDVIDYGFLPKIELTKSGSIYPKSSVPLRVSIAGGKEISAETMEIMFISHTGV